MLTCLVYRVSFGGTLKDLLDELEATLPPVPEGQAGGSWYGPSPVVGAEDSAVQRVLVVSGRGLSSSAVETLLSCVSSGDCLLFLESGLPGRHNSTFPSLPVPTIRGCSLDRRISAGASHRWLSNISGRLQASGASLIFAGNTWEAWERGPAAVLSERIEVAVPVVRTSPVAGFLQEPAYKIVVFVPEGHEDRVRDAMAEAGAGHIGKYSHCTFQVLGQGTFLPLQGANPFLGSVGRLERASEYRLETIVRKRLLSRVIDAMLKVHPYEEVAYDVYRLENGSLRLARTMQVCLESPVTLEVIRKVVADSCKPIGDDRQGSSPGTRGDANTSCATETGKVCVALCADTEGVEGAAAAGVPVIACVSSTPEAMLWAERLDICLVQAGTWVYDAVARELARALSRGGNVEKITPAQPGSALSCG